MNEQAEYMQDFMKIFQPLKRWGPGSEADTLRALRQLPESTSSLLEIGSGNGLATKVIVENTRANVTAVDSEASALERLNTMLTQGDFKDRVTTACQDMADLDFAEESFQAVWSEGSAYIIGVEKALAKWRKFIVPNGYLVVSDLVWRTDEPSEAAVAFWTTEYPDMQSVSLRQQQMQNAGYRLIEDFPHSQASWDNYYVPLTNRLQALHDSMHESAAYQDIAREVSVATRFVEEFGYHMFVLQKID